MKGTTVDLTTTLPTVRVGDIAIFGGIYSQVIRSGITVSADGTVTPIVALADGRRFEGEVAHYVERA